MPMTEPKYRSAPIPSTSMPPGIPYIVGNEAAERFSFYGMRAILVIFMTKHLMGFGGQLDVMTEETAKFYFHLFVASAYFFPFLGAIVSDALLGKYRTILTLSLVYCLGHLALAVNETRIGLFAGLILISIGAGGIKSCVSAHVGDQFGATNKHLLEKVFGWFYFAINLGAATSMLLTPLLLDLSGPKLAFGVPGVLMFLATFVFWLGRHKFIHVPPSGRKFFAEAFSAEGVKALGKLCLIYVFIAMFWCVFDQTGSAWVLQANRMDRYWMGVTWLPSQIQAVNSILILIFIPTFAYVVYPAVSRVFTMTPLRKICIGLFLACGAAAVPAWIEMKIEAGPQSEAVTQSFAQVDADADGRISLDEFYFPDEIDRDGAEQLFVSLDSSEGDGLNREEFAAIADKVPAWLRGELTDKPDDDFLDRTFKGIDKRDRDAITHEEFLSAWEKHKEKVEKTYKTLDHNKSEGLSADEFDDDVLKRAFFKLDANADRRVSSEEFHFAGEQDSSSAGRLHTRLDTDGDGSVTLAEFRLAEMPNIIWQLFGYVILTAAEVMVSITGLEFSYTQAPKKAKSLVMGLFFLAVSAGNVFTALVNHFNVNADGTTKMTDSEYYWFFAALMLAAAVVFIAVAATYREQTYIQDEAD